MANRVPKWWRDRYTINFARVGAKNVVKNVLESLREGGIIDIIDIIDIR